MANSRQPLEWTDDDFYALIHETDTTPLDDSGPSYFNRMRAEAKVARRWEDVAFFAGLGLGIFLNVVCTAVVLFFEWLF